MSFCSSSSSDLAFSSAVMQKDDATAVENAIKAGAPVDKELNQVCLQQIETGVELIRTESGRSNTVRLHT